MSSVDRFVMRRELGLWSVLSIIVGLIIGSGIFITPSVVLQHTGSPALSLIMWVLPALLSLLVGLCFLELFSAMPVSGGEYRYYNELYGPVVGFLSAWTFNLQLKTVYRAILCLTISKLLLVPVYTDCSPPTIVVKLTSLCILFAVTAVNGVYVNIVTKLQAFFSAMKVIVLAIIIIAGCVRLAQGHTGGLEIGFSGSNTSAGAMAVSIQVGIFIYIGWNDIVNVIEEVKNPERDVPLGLFLSLIFVACLYLLTNVAYFTALSPEELLKAPMVVTSFAEKTFGPVAFVAPICVAITVIGSLNASMLTAARIVFAAAQDGLLPSIMATIHLKFRTPLVALYFQSGIAALYICIGDLGQLIESLGIVYTLVFMTLSLSVLYIRSGRTRFEPTMKMPLGVPIISTLLNLSLYILGSIQNPTGNLAATGMIAAGIPVYFIFVLGSKKVPQVDKFLDDMNLRIQKVMLVAPPENEKDF